jgi:hypothetical protein
VLAKQHFSRLARPVGRALCRRANQIEAESEMSAEASSARRGSRKRDPSLTDLDLRILDLICSQRVLTSPQLAALAPETSARTLRYRCNRLAKLGLLGRTRPYRERGTAPHHLWPTRKGEALASGEPPPRGGERREPNPLFLAHAAGLSEIYVVLKTALPADLRLTSFEREADAREPFARWPAKEERAIAPDVFIEIADADGRKLCAFVELDRGTMSHRQLTRKAAGYAEYDRAEAWRDRHRFCPALLFITTTDKRARSFLLAMRKQAEREALLFTGACDLARKLRRCTTEPRWLIDGSDEPVDLLAVLREARRPYDEELAREEACRREEEEKRERLRTDPEALRSHLRSRPPPDRDADHPLMAAFAITLAREAPPEEVERDALLALAGMYADPLSFRFADRMSTEEEQRAFDALVKHYRVAQRERFEDLAGRYGEGPALRRARERIAIGELLDDAALDSLASTAERDCASRAEQKRLREDYLIWRAEEARRLAKAQGLLTRLRNRPESFLDQIDSRSLRRCGRCEEVAYPNPERAESYAKRHVAQRCHYCGAAFPEAGPSPADGGEPWSQW